MIDTCFKMYWKIAIFLRSWNFIARIARLSNKGVSKPKTSIRENNRCKIQANCNVFKVILTHKWAIEPNLYTWYYENLSYVFFPSQTTDSIVRVKPKRKIVNLACTLIRWYVICQRCGNPVYGFYNEFFKVTTCYTCEICHFESQLELDTLKFREENFDLNFARVEYLLLEGNRVFGKILLHSKGLFDCANLNRWDKFEYSDFFNWVR